MGNAYGKSFGPEASNILRKPVNYEISNNNMEVATFAGGCFWGIQLAFQRVPGVLSTEVGYTQGHIQNPTYEEVCRGTTGHTEAIRIVFNPEIISYIELLVILWDRIDPTTLNRQGNDAGSQYRSGIYYHNENQRNIALKSKENEQIKYNNPIVTEILPAKEWYPAEEYHQRYLEKGGQCALTGSLHPIRCYG